MSFSQGVKITDVSDYITPSQVCIVPVKVEGLSKTGPKIKIKGDDYDQIDYPEEKVSITLNDCLACSGCVTTAETVLINEQSNTQFLKQIKQLKATNENSFVVVSLSPQSIASLSVRFNLGNIHDSRLKLSKFFRSLSVDVVLNTNFGREISLLELAKDVNERMGKGVVVSSACPGWVCYAEKHKENKILVPLISKVRSPQHMMGLLVKKLLPQMNPKYANKRIYHATIMPCYDKKLEASRKEFTFVDDASGEVIREVDLVLSSVEIESLIVENGYDFCVSPISNGEPHEVELLFDTHDSNADSGSGGYLEAAFRHCAKEMYNMTLVAGDVCQDPRVSVRIVKNDNFRVLTLHSVVPGDEAAAKGTPLLKFAYAYGFKNIQNIVQSVRKKVCQYDFVEIMACPGGCINGGGQVRVVDEGVAAREAYRGSGTQMRQLGMSEAVRAVYKTLDHSDVLHTTYNIVKPLDAINPAAFQW